MKKVTGIGGVFFKCKDPNKMKEWYKNPFRNRRGSIWGVF
jgi:hypothetical protein